MILITYIARIADGLALAASVQEDEKVRTTLLTVTLTVRLRVTHWVVSELVSTQLELLLP